MPDPEFRIGLHNVMISVFARNEICFIMRSSKLVNRKNAYRRRTYTQKCAVHTLPWMTISWIIIKHIRRMSVRSTSLRRCHRWYRYALFVCFLVVTAVAVASGLERTLNVSRRRQ